MKIFIHSGHRSLLKYESMLLEQIGLSVDGGNFTDDFTHEGYDALYITQIPQLLDRYGLPALKAGKPVIFRTFGANLKRWGSTPQDVKKFYNYNKLHIVSATKAEAKMWGGRARPILPVPILDSPDVDLRENGFMIANPRFTKMRELAVMIQPKGRRGAIPPSEWINLLAGSRFYIDTLLHKFAIRYMSLEAMLLGVPTIFPAGSALYNMITKDGHDCRDVSYQTVDAAVARATNILANDTIRTRIGNAQRKYVLNKIDESKNGWVKLFKV